MHEEHTDTTVSPDQQLTNATAAPSRGRAHSTHRTYRPVELVAVAKFATVVLNPATSFWYFMNRTCVFVADEVSFVSDQSPDGERAD